MLLNLTYLLNKVIAMLSVQNISKCKIKVCSNFSKSHIECEEQMELIRFNEEFRFFRYNMTHFLANKINYQSGRSSSITHKTTHDYFVLIFSIFECLVSDDLQVENTNKQQLLDSSVLKSQQVISLKHNSTIKAENQTLAWTWTDLLLDSELQPVLYVTVILGILMIIFALLLIFSSRVNKHERETYESKMFIKRWRWRDSSEENSKIRKTKRRRTMIIRSTKSLFKDSSVGFRNKTQDRKQTKSIELEHTQPVGVISNKSSSNDSFNSPKEEDLANTRKAFLKVMSFDI